MHRSKKARLRQIANCLPPHLHTTSITTYTYHNHIYSTTTTTTTTTTTQCKLLYAQVVLGKRPPAQVAEGNHHKCRVCVCASCWNEKHHQRKLLKVRGTGHQHPSAQVGAGAATTCNLHMDATCIVVVPMCIMHGVFILIHLTTTTTTKKHHRHHQKNTTTQCKLLERKYGICASGWKEKHHQRKLQWVKPPRVQVEYLCQLLREKHHHRKLVPVTTP